MGLSSGMLTSKGTPAAALLQLALAVGVWAGVGLRAMVAIRVGSALGAGVGLAVGVAF